APIGEVVESCLSRSQNLIMLDDGVCADLKQNNLNLEVISMDSDLKLKKVLVEKVWRRNAPSKMLKFEFASGKQIMVTAEHPFFTLSDAQMIMKRADNFSTGEYVASPRELKVANEYQKISMLHPSLKYIGCEEPISESIRGMQWEQPLTFVATDSKTSYRTLRNLKEGVRKSIFLSEIKTICMHSGQDPDSYISRFTHAVAGTSSLQMPFHRHLLLDEGFARFLGLLMGDGHLDEHKIEFTNTNADIRNEFGRLATDIFGVRGRTIVPSERSPNYQITCKPLYYLLKDNVGIIAGDKASTQAIPEKILLSPNSTLAAFIGGYFDCDSSVSLNNNEIEFSSASQAIANQMQLALQRFGIVSTLKTKLVGGVSYYRLFIRGENAAKFAKTIPMHHPEKMLRLKKILSADSFNSNIDIVPNSWNLLKACKAKFGIGKTSLDQHNLTQRVLQRLHSKLVARGLEKESLSDSIKKLAFNDVFWDRIVSIQEIPYGEKHVYDLTVGGTHSFVANGVIVHNTSMLQAMMQEIPQNLRIIVQEDTLELPVHSLKHLGFSIQRLKTRAPLGMQSEAEVSAEDALRTALRLGDSVLIVGEVRSGEAKALFEAMRVGAVGNVVMGTIHGESAYSIWDRIVNDLGVPTTSFKATDFAIVATQIRFKGSLKRARRLIEITEVKKHWTQDPDKEDGFLNWMMFDAGKDDLDFFEDKLKESEWLEKLQKTRGLKLEQIWAEIRARAEAKQYLVDLKRKYSIPKLLEAENTLPAHSRYMLYSEQQREEHGGVDHKQLIKDWKLWVDDYLAKPLLKK
ncbi:MAG TPA: ATPase, T2SS/T4P/T4SS family, partial [Candidatus Norongarragalinales archaeon]|nr:ATPase, T2SS/T4P/T4SS family [Candidatus Norongarragalinales archaeon]